MTFAPSNISEGVQETLQHFWEAVPAFWNRVRVHIRQEAAENYGITVEQFHILRHIHKGFDSTSELASVRQISRPAVSQAVGALVQDGLVVRQYDQIDRRYIRLALTPEGEALLAGIFEKTSQWMAEKLSRLNAQEIAEMNKGFIVMRKLVDEEFD
jgi:DNA-binding MarR family transcriptional regulator